MANEITITTAFDVRKGNLQFTFAPGNYQADMVGKGGPTPGYVTIGTTEEEVDFSELGDAGFVVIQNLDTDNFVEWGFSTGVYGAEVFPGEIAGPFRLSESASLFLKADTAACKMLILGFER